MTRIYVITNLLNDRQYVGKTINTISQRFYQHCNNDHYHTYIHNAIKKYGKENFTIEEICTCEDDRWKELERFYIKKLHTHYSEGGYNITWGGDDNPMDDDEVKRRHKELMCTAEHRKRDSEIIRKYNSSELRKLNDLKQSERQKGVYVDQFRNWNDSRKQPIAMLDDDGNEVMRFESCSDACRYLHDVECRKADASYVAVFKKFADKFNKNGKRSKFLGHPWRML